MKPEKLLAGPFLYADSNDETSWSFWIGALLHTGPQGPEVVVSATQGSSPVSIGDPVLVDDFTSVGMGCFWRWRVSAVRKPAADSLGYTLDFRGGGVLAVDGVRIPARDRLPNVAFFSCNGVSSEKLLHKTNLEVLWEDLVSRHEDGGEGYHLLVGGGDQLYADSLWTTNRRLKALGALSQKKREAAPQPPELEQELLRDFVGLYVERWGKAGPAKAFARIPGVFTWDDHDIVDGWGSLPPGLQASPSYQTLFRVAARCFEAFQLCGVDRGLVLPGAAPRTGPYLQALSLSNSTARLDLLLLDLRSRRTMNQVLGEDQWGALKGYFDTNAQTVPGKPRHLLVVSSVPVVYLQFGGVEAVLGRIPREQEIEDDLRDHWESPLHRGERARLLMNLLQHASDTATRVTLLSGDVHVGSRGRIVSHRPEHVIQGPQVIEQIVSSGIGHPPPGWLEWQGILLTGSEAEGTVAENVTTELVDVTCGLRFLRMRNWLSMAFEGPSTTSGVKMWLQWMTESGGVEPQVVIESKGVS